MINCGELVKVVGIVTDVSYYRISRNRKKVSCTAEFSGIGMKDFTYMSLSTKVGDKISVYWNGKDIDTMFVDTMKVDKHAFIVMLVAAIFFSSMFISILRG